VWALWNLAVEWPDWEIPWAGIGAFLMGAGSFLTGYAALRTSRRRGAQEEREKGARGEDAVAPDPPAD
jgi:hypothetical protein